MTDSLIEPDRSGREPQHSLSAHIQACRQRIPLFVSNHYAWPGAWRLNRLAWGWDIAIAPLNFLLGFPNFLVKLLSLLLEGLRLRQTADWLRHLHLGLPTRIQQHLAMRLQNDLLHLPAKNKTSDNPTLKLLVAVAEKPTQLYIQTRNIAADITAGTIAAILGLIFFNQFTPGSISAGSMIAKELAREQAISDFLFGETLGALYYTLFPVSPSLSIIVISLLVIMMLIALVSAFSGIIHDPIQAATGIHQRRLNHLLNAIESAAQHATDKGYRPKDTFFGRIYDLIDWIKGLLSF
jgi:hypothetical protein